MSVPPEKREEHPLLSRHFLLLIAFLAALLVTEAMVFTLFDGSERKDVLGMAFGLFGAWIGAGAAYFFGRENMRTATESMLKMRGRSPTEILAGTRLSDMKPKALPETFKINDSVSEILAWLEKKEKRFFAVVVDENEKFEYAVDEEALYRFVNQQMKEGGADYASAGARPVGEVVKAFKDDKDLRSLIKAAAAMDQDATAFAANEKMEDEKVFVTIVLNNEKQPTGYITSGDIRKLMLTPTVPSP
jgi:hypothetical protein